MPGFSRLTGNAAGVAAVVCPCQFASRPAPNSTPATPCIDHTGSVFVRDPGGRLRLLWPGDMAAGDMAQGLQALLASA